MTHGCRAVQDAVSTADVELRRLAAALDSSRQQAADTEAERGAAQAELAATLAHVSSLQAQLSAQAERLSVQASATQAAAKEIARLEQQLSDARDEARGAQEAADVAALKLHHLEAGRARDGDTIAFLQASAGELQARFDALRGSVQAAHDAALGQAAAALDAVQRAAQEQAAAAARQLEVEAEARWGRLPGDQGLDHACRGVGSGAMGLWVYGCKLAQYALHGALNCSRVLPPATCTRCATRLHIPRHTCHLTPCACVHARRRNERSAAQAAMRRALDADARSAAAEADSEAALRQAGELPVMRVRLAQLEKQVGEVAIDGAFRMEHNPPVAADHLLYNCFGEHLELALCIPCTCRARISWLPGVSMTSLVPLPLPLAWHGMLPAAGGGA